jgi:hypothetical protein
MRLRSGPSAGPPFEQRQADRLFELRDPLRQRRLGEVHLTSGGADAAMVHRGDDGGEVPEIEIAELHEAGLA